MPLDPDTTYDIWRPASSVWSRWAKPVLFAYLDDDFKTGDPHPAPQEWIIPHNPHQAILADLPGPEGITAGIAFARAQWRPVPVYNAVPFPASVSYADEILSVTTIPRMRPATTVDVESILYALAAHTSALAACRVAGQAPPAFLTDSNRAGSARPDPGWFDNRSFLSTSDFPSGEFLQSHGVGEIVLVRRDVRIAWDLQLVLSAWQRAGLAVRFQVVWQPWDPKPYRIKTPSLLARAWHALRRTLGYPEHGAGAFGEWSRASNS